MRDDEKPEATDQDPGPIRESDVTPADKLDEGDLTESDAERLSEGNGS